MFEQLKGGRIMRPPKSAEPMQHWSLSIDKIIDHAARWHGATEIVSRTGSDKIERLDYMAIKSSACRLTNALLEHGIMEGDRVATLAMNGGAHLAAWFGIMGMGAVCHTLNPRLSDDQLIYIINHAEDRIILADPGFAVQIERLRSSCATIEKVVYFDTKGPQGWDEFLLPHGEQCTWGMFSENTPAGLCYTSGTTGQPKGVLYTHRSNYLHTMMVIQPDVFNLSACDVILPVVPMFHANAWGLTFAAAAVGAKLVLPGARLDGASLYELIESEGVTFTAGVPTVWQTLLQFMDDNRLKFTTLKRAMIGGAACPESLMRAFEGHGVEVQHNWGMTETSPLGTAGSPTASTAKLSGEAQLVYRLKQGRVPLGVDMRIVNPESAILPRDGQSVGLLGVSGHSVIDRYYQESYDRLDKTGFFDTGDVGTIDPLGYLKITDRAKDVIKSGGEWISSLELETTAMEHHDVEMAAAIGVTHPKWGERPLLIIQLREGAPQNTNEIMGLLAPRMAKWALPDRILFVESLPLGATGKIDKKELRNRYIQDAVYN
jgi:acyl-CoA synthetase (AMP-forming)/AMP-acid ligase II